MAKQLTDIIKDLNVKQIVGNVDVTITDVVADSRKATKGTLFVAVRGVAVDAHRFITQVVDAGAAAVVCEELPEQCNDSATYIVVPDSTVALAQMASAWYD